MAELVPPDSGRCTCFFLYDGSKVKEEGDPTRAGICYFYPEETPLDRQELLCGQLAGVGRCVSELSFSPVRTLKLRRSKFAIRMEDDFFWALGCSAEVPAVSVCQLLDQLIGLFCFYNGSVRRSYQVRLETSRLVLLTSSHMKPGLMKPNIPDLNSRDALAARWAQYLSHLQSGSSELHHIFSCVRTIDATNVDPLLLLKAALILQACQRCPLVSAGCILFRGRVVSTQMCPELTMKVMVHETETYAKAQRATESGASDPFGGSVSSTTVFLTTSELQSLQSVPVDKEFRSHSTPLKAAPPTKIRLSRTLSDVASTESETSDPGSSLPPRKVSLPDRPVFSPVPSQGPADPWLTRPLFLNGQHEAEEEESCYHSFQSNAGADGPTQNEGDAAALEENRHLNSGGGDLACGAASDARGAESRDRDPPPVFDIPEQSPLIPMALYLHRVKGLVLALLVEPHFSGDTASMEEVYHSSLASLNGLEAHLRTISPGAPGPPGPYSFAHFDCVQSTLTANLSARPGGATDRPFVRATSLLHSHFCTAESLQEAIIRSAGAAVYGTRSVAQETYFQQHGGSLRNSGIPNHQDSAFTLPGKARHRLLKHGINLL